MAIRLEKGQRINLEKNNGSKLTDFCVGCNWGAIVTSGGFLGMGKKTQDVDLDLSCVMVDANGNLVDHIYSPLYKHEFLARYGMPPAKSTPTTALSITVAMTSTAIPKAMTDSTMRLSQ